MSTEKSEQPLATLAPPPGRRIRNPNGEVPEIPQPSAFTSNPNAEVVPDMVPQRAPLLAPSPFDPPPARGISNLSSEDLEMAPQKAAPLAPLAPPPGRGIINNPNSEVPEMPQPAPPSGGVGINPRGDVHMAMTGGGQVQPHMFPPNVIVTRGTGPVRWSTGLCGCCSDMESCCITCFVPCISFGKIAEIVDQKSSSCPINTAIYTLLLALFGCACMYSCFYRNMMRKQYNLQGSECKDCCTHFWCECCALCQEYRELKNRGFDMSFFGERNSMVQRQNLDATMAPPMQTVMRR